MTFQGRVYNCRCKCKRPSRRIIKGRNKNYACTVVLVHSHNVHVVEVAAVPRRPVLVHRKI